MRQSITPFSILPSLTNKLTKYVYIIDEHKNIIFHYMVHDETMNGLKVLYFYIFIVTSKTKFSTSVFNPTADFLSFFFFGYAFLHKQRNKKSFCIPNAWLILAPKKNRFFFSVHQLMHPHSHLMADGWRIEEIYMRIKYITQLH